MPSRSWEISLDRKGSWGWENSRSRKSCCNWENCRNRKNCWDWEDSWKREDYWSGQVDLGWKNCWSVKARWGVKEYSKTVLSPFYCRSWWCQSPLGDSLPVGRLANQAVGDNVDPSGALIREDSLSSKEVDCRSACRSVCGKDRTGRKDSGGSCWAGGLSLGWSTCSWRENNWKDRRDTWQNYLNRKYHGEVDDSISTQRGRSDQVDRSIKRSWSHQGNIGH